MEILCACCGKIFEQKNPLINLCKKCSKKATKSLKDLYNEKSKYCAFKYSCSRSIFYGKNK